MEKISSVPFRYLFPFILWHLVAMNSAHPKVADNGIPTKAKQSKAIICQRYIYSKIKTIITGRTTLNEL